MSAHFAKTFIKQKQSSQKYTSLKHQLKGFLYQHIKLHCWILCSINLCRNGLEVFLFLAHKTMSAKDGLPIYHRQFLHWYSHSLFKHFIRECWNSNLNRILFAFCWSWSHFMIIFQEEQGRECSDSFPAASFQSNILPITSWSASFQSNISPTSSSATFQGIISK